MGTLAGLTDTKIVRTPAFHKVRSAADFVLPRREIMLIHGPNGAGKRTALADYLDSQPLPVTTLALPPTQSSKDVVRWLHRSVLDGEDLPERTLQDDLVQALSEQPRVVVVHQAHRLTAEAAGQLEYLHSRPGHDWALVLVGGIKSGSAITRDPLLSDAVAATVAVEPLTGLDLIRTLQSMHDLLLGAGVELLTEIDSRVCHGLLHNWARFLQHALHLRQLAVDKGKDAPVLDRHLARAVLHSLPATMKAKPQP